MMAVIRSVCIYNARMKWAPFAMPGFSVWATQGWGGDGRVPARKPDDSKSGSKNLIFADTKRVCSKSSSTAKADLLFYIAYMREKGGKKRKLLEVETKWWPFYRQHFNASSCMKSVAFWLNSVKFVCKGPIAHWRWFRYGIGARRQAIMVYFPFWMNALNVYDLFEDKIITLSFLCVHPE